MLHTFAMVDNTRSRRVQANSIKLLKSFSIDLKSIFVFRDVIELFVCPVCKYRRIALIEVLFASLAPAIGCKSSTSGGAGLAILLLVVVVV